ncbi:MAG: rhodanese-like domain-containing protein [Anaerolineae bacterium]|nr:rhodanese-like domain-containing protein [Anaerolineae bacterium]
MGIFDIFSRTKVPQIDVREANSRLKADKNVIIVDVRQPNETSSGVVPGAKLIPLSEFGSRMNELPLDKPILTICQSSHRSPFAARKLAKAGYDVTNVSGGMMAWRKAGLPIKKR